MATAGKGIAATGSGAVGDDVPIVELGQADLGLALRGLRAVGRHVDDGRREVDAR